MLDVLQVKCLRFYVIGHEPRCMEIFGKVLKKMIVLSSTFGIVSSKPMFLYSK